MVATYKCKIFTYFYHLIQCETHNDDRATGERDIGICNKNFQYAVNSELNSVSQISFTF